MHIRCEKSMSDIVAKRCHALDQFLNRAQEVERNEPDTMVLPQALLGNSSGGDYDLGPGQSTISCAFRPWDIKVRTIRTLVCGSGAQ